MKPGLRPLIAGFLTFCAILAYYGANGDTLPIPDPFGGREYPGAWIVLVEESGERSDSAAIFARNTAYHADLKSRGLNWSIYDDDSPDAAQYRAKAESVGYPALVIVDADRKLLDARKWPDDQESLDRAIKEVTGL